MAKESISPQSRYYPGYSKGTMEFRQPDGNIIPYLRRRFIPRAALIPVAGEYTVTEGDRIDTIAYGLIGDPEMFWMLCDTNNEMNPGNLTRFTGRIIRIPLPGGITQIEMNRY